MTLEEPLINHVLAAARRIGRSGAPTSGYGHPVHAPDVVTPSRPAQHVLAENSIDQRFLDSFSSPVASLAARLVDGDELALHEMFTRWSRLVHTIARSALGSNADADDVTQQVFIAAWKSRQTLRPSDEALPAWLLGICRFKIADALRARSRSSRIEDSAAHGASAETSSHVDDVVDRVVVHDALEAMGDPRGKILRMVFLEDKTHEVVSRELAIPLGTVKSHVRRGLERLRNMFEEVDSSHV